MKKLLFITTRLFWPTDSGRKTSLYFYCKGLHEVYGYDIYLYSFLEFGQTQGMVNNRPDFIKEVRIAEPIGKSKKIINLIGKSLFCGWPFQNSIYFSNKNKKSLKLYCDEIQPDAIVVDMIRLAPYFASFKKRTCIKILDLDDLLSKRYARQATGKNAKGALLGVYAENASKASNKIINKPWLKRIVLKSESKRVKKAELKYSRLYDSVIFVSDFETNEMNERLEQNKAVTVALGIDYDYFGNFSPVPKEKGALAFLGNMKVAANVDSLNLIVTEVLPKIKSEVKLYIIGTCPDEVKQQFADSRLVFCGMEEDIRPIIGKCEIFLSPIAYGTGIKTKILEAMASGIPVITNSVGIEGIMGTSGEHFVVADDAETMAAQVDELLSDPDIARKYALNGKELAKNKYDWKNIYGSFADAGIKK